MSKLNAVQVNLVEDIFDTRSVDPDGKKFDKVSRIFGESESFKMGLIFDFHADIFPIKEGDKLRIVITKNVLNDALADVDDDHEDDAAEETDERLANSKIAEFDYVVYGKIYRIEPAESETDPSRLKVYISFGGLLMQLTGDASNLKGMSLNRQIIRIVTIEVINIKDKENNKVFIVGIDDCLTVLIIPVCNFYYYYPKTVKLLKAIAGDISLNLFAMPRNPTAIGRWEG